MARMNLRGPRYSTGVFSKKTFSLVTGRYSMASLKHYIRAELSS